MKPAASTVLDALADIPGRYSTDISLPQSSRRLVYLVHGITGTPSEMRYLAAGLSRQGFAVYATTLPGHCRRLRDLIQTDEHRWQDHVQQQLRFAQRQYEHVFAAGLSAGGTLVLDAAADIPLAGLAVMSPTFMYDGWNTPWSNAILPLAMRWVPERLQHFLFHIDGPPFGIKEPFLQTQVAHSYNRGAMWREWLDCWRPAWSRPKEPEDQAASASKGYPLFPLKCLTQVDRLTRRVRARLNTIQTPTLILQARQDDMTSPRNAQLLYDALGCAEKEIILLDDCYHVITVDKKRKEVVQRMSSFFHHLRP